MMKKYIQHNQENVSFIYLLQPKKSGGEIMEQKIVSLNEEEIERLNSRRKWVRQHFTPESEYKYEILEEKLNLLDTIIKSDWISKDETVKLQSLGVTFGDCLAQKMDLKWMSVEDDYGKDPSLILEGTSIV